VLFRNFFIFTVDAITALEYNINGDFLATGDRSGRITVLKIDEDDRKKAEVVIWHNRNFSKLIIFYFSRTKKIGLHIFNIKVMIQSLIF
jgi:hypothetical protein